MRYNYIGIYLGYGSQQNTVTRNNITNSVIKGVALYVSNNVIYDNNFINNAVQASANGDGTNFWDNGSVGNYWSDYNGTDADGDGVGDAPHVIAENNQDNYPLMAPYNEPEPTPEPQEPEPFPNVPIVAVSTASPSQLVQA